MLRRWPNAYPFGRLHRLSFIHFAHWAVFDRIPPNGGREARKLPHPYLIFQTNFNRGWREYVEGFCYVVPVGLRFNWSGFPVLRRLFSMRAYGFPPPKPPGPFLDYVEERFNLPPQDPAVARSHHYCAYPDVSTRAVIAKVDAREKFGLFAGAGTRPPDRFVPPARGPTPLGGPRDKTDTLTVLTPVIPGRVAALRNVLSGLPGWDQSPLARVPDTHMARWSVVDPLPFKKGRRRINSTSYLLFTSWFDGKVDGYIRGLRAHLDRVESLGNANLADAIWGNCVGYPGTQDVNEFLDYLLLYSIQPRLAFAGYPQKTAEVRAAVRLHERLSPILAEAARCSTADLEKAYRPNPDAGT
jgi:hypothetical protein